MLPSPRAARFGAWLLCSLGVLVVVLRIALFPWAVSDPVHSRWLTIEALVEDRTFAVGFRVEEDGAYRDVGRVKTLPTVDVMLDPETKTFYSSKPPLLQVLYAPLVQGLAWLGGIADVSFARASLLRWLLLLVHALPFALCLAWLTSWLLAHERPAVTLVVVLVAGLGTFVTTFSNALQNHVPAALATWICALSLMRILDGHRGGVWFALCGLAAGFAAALEYPAGTLVVAVVVVLSRFDRQKAALIVVPAALVPLLLSHSLDYVVFGEPLFFFRREADWFRYDGSYWQAPNGLDADDPSRVTYVFHFLLGHHGALLLAPFFACGLLSALAATHGASTPRRARSVGAAALVLALASLLVSQMDGGYRLALIPLLPLMVLPLALLGAALPSRAEASAALLLCCALPTTTFYLSLTNNFGGLTSGPRWLLWLTPLWLLCLPRVVEWLLVGPRRRVVLLLLLLSLTLWSTLSPGANPYRHPWSYDLYRLL